MGMLFLGPEATAGENIQNPLYFEAPLLIPDVSIESEGDIYRNLLSYQFFLPWDCAPEFSRIQLKLAPLAQYQFGYKQQRLKYGGRLIALLYDAKSTLIFSDWLLVRDFDRETISHQVSAGVYLGPLMLSLNQDQNRNFYRKSISIGLSLIGFFTSMD